VQNQQVNNQKTRILFLLDGSNSMNSDWNNELRHEVAKEILGNLVDSLQDIPNLELALRVYGHQSPKHQQDCKDTKLEVGFAKSNAEKIKSQLENIIPQGVTPLAYSLQQAANDFPDKNARNIIIIITDGLESCSGDPCKISLSLQKKNIFLKPFVIGLGLDEDYTKDFECLGSYINATSKSSLKQLLQKVMIQALGNTEVRVDLLDENNKATETDVNITFQNATTGDILYDFVHYIDAKGKIDLVEIDPVITYNIRVNTIPPVYLSDVEIEGGKLNIIEITTPQGDLSVEMKNFKEYGNLSALIKSENDNKTIHSFNVSNNNIKLLEGTYELELLTLPRIRKTFSIKGSEITSIQINQPGRLNISENKKGFGSIYKVSQNGSDKWIYNFRDSSQSIAMQPGKYKIVFRSENALGIEFTTTKYFTITSGSSTSVKLY